jgi:hypothetical protein
MRLSVVCLVLAVAACAPDPEKQRLRETTRPTYDRETGRLTELTYDASKDGVIDTWTYMDGARVLRVEMDTNQDGKIDRWEYYAEDATLEKVGFSRVGDGTADAWAFEGAGGQVARLEIDTRGDGEVDRWEFYGEGVLVRAEEDTSGTGRPDKWEVYEAGAIVSAAFDETGDGRPDRRLTYAPGGRLVSIESEPDAAGAFATKITVVQ